MRASESEPERAREIQRDTDVAREIQSEPDVAREIQRDTDVAREIQRDTDVAREIQRDTDLPVNIKKRPREALYTERVFSRDTSLNGLPISWSMQNIMVRDNDQLRVPIA